MRKRGLPYQWWKDLDLWLEVGSAIVLGVILFLLLAAWFLDWKPWW